MSSSPRSRTKPLLAPLLSAFSSSLSGPPSPVVAASSGSPFSHVAFSRPERFAKPSQRTGQLQEQHLPEQETLSGRVTSDGSSEADDDILPAKVVRRCGCCCGGCLMSRRRWFCFLGSIISLSTLLVALVMLYAVIPAMIRSQLKHSTLNFDGLQVHGVPSNASVHLLAQGSVGHVLNLVARMDDAVFTLYGLPANDSSSTALSLGDSASDSWTELGSLPFPRMTLHGASSFALDTVFTVGPHAGAFQGWLRTIIFQQSIIWRVESRVAITPMLFGVIPLVRTTDLPLSKEVTVTGCSGLGDVKLIKFDVSTSTQTAIIVTATIQLVNPSLFALKPLGALHFDFLYNGFYQGSLRSILPPNETALAVGTNLLSFEGEMLPDEANLNATHEFVVRFLTGHDSVVEARPNPLDGSSIPMYNEALAGLSLPTVLPGLNRSLIGDVGVLSAHMSPSLTDASIDFDMDIFFTLDSPLGPNALLTPHTIQMDVTLLSPTVENEAPVAIGTLTMLTPTAVTPYTTKALTYRVHLRAALDLLEPTENYEAFVSNFVASPGMVSLHFTGRANVSATYLYGPIDIVDLPVDVGILMQGGGGLNRTMQKSLTVKGNRERCSSVPDSNSALSPTADSPLCGVEVSMTASIFNPSLLTLNLSDSWFDLYWSNARLGSLQVLPLFMQPGWNEDVVASGFLNPAAEHLPDLASFMSTYIAGQNHTMQLRGRRTDPPSLPAGERHTDPNSAHAITLGGLEVSATCVGQRIDLLSNFAIQRFILEFHQPESGAPELPYVITTSGVVTAEVHMPTSMQLPLTLLSSDISFNVSVPNGILGELKMARIPVTYAEGSNTSLILSFTGSPFSVTNAEGFSDFTSSMVSSLGVNVTMDGYANPTAQTNMGVIELKHVHQQSVVPLTGYNSFFAPDGITSLLTINSLDILSARPPIPSATYAGGGSVELACNVSLLNPSQVSIVGLGMFHMDMYYQGVRLVTVHLANFSVEAGLNIYADTCHGTFSEPLVKNGNYSDMMTARAFLSSYLNGGDTPVVMLGKILQDDGSYLPGTSIPLLQPAFSAFSTSVIAPGNTHAFVQALVVELTVAQIMVLWANKTGGGMVAAKAKLYNPFSISLSVTNLTLTVLAGDLSAPVGGWLVPSGNETAIFLEPHSEVTSPSLPVYLRWTPTVVTMIMSFVLGGFKPIGVSLIGDLTVWIDSKHPGWPNPATTFNQTMNVAQNMISTTVTISAGESLAEDEEQRRQLMALLAEATLQAE